MDKKQDIFDKNQFTPVLIKILIDSSNSWDYGWKASLFCK